VIAVAAVDSFTGSRHQTPSPLRQRGRHRHCRRRYPAGEEPIEGVDKAALAGRSPPTAIAALDAAVAREIGADGAFAGSARTMSSASAPIDHQWPMRCPANSPR
jgi:hypothetical protein